MAFFRVKNVHIGRPCVARAHRHYVPGQIWHQSSLFKLPSTLYRASPDRSSQEATPGRHNASGFAFGFDPTGRCHKREFLLKFAKDRHRWLQWLYQARRRYELAILNYTVTSNHIHLIAYDDSGRQNIAA
jgi:hypothetical protein